MLPFHLYRDLMISFYAMSTIVSTVYTVVFYSIYTYCYRENGILFSVIGSFVDCLVAALATCVSETVLTNEYIEPHWPTNFASTYGGCGLLIFFYAILRVIIYMDLAALDQSISSEPLGQRICVILSLLFSCAVLAVVAAHCISIVVLVAFHVSIASAEMIIAAYRLSQIEHQLLIEATQNAVTTLSTSAHAILKNTTVA